MTTPTLDPWAITEADGPTLLRHLLDTGRTQRQIAHDAGILEKTVSTLKRCGTCSKPTRNALAKLWCQVAGLPEPDIDPVPVPAWLQDDMWRVAEDLRQRRFTEIPKQWRNTTHIIHNRPPVAPLSEMTGLPLARIETIIGAARIRPRGHRMITPREMDTICTRLGILNRDAYGIPA
jgi:hypothetical protein